MEKESKLTNSDREVSAAEMLRAALKRPLLANLYGVPVLDVSQREIALIAMRQEDLKLIEELGA